MLHTNLILKPRNAKWYARIQVNYKEWLQELPKDTDKRTRVMAYALTLLAEEGEFFGTDGMLLAALRQ